MSPKNPSIPPDLLRVGLAVLAILGTLYALVLLAWAGVGTGTDPRLPGLLRYRHPGQIWGLVAGAAVAFGLTILAFWLLARARRHGTAAACVALILIAAFVLNLEPRLAGPPILVDGSWFIAPLLGPSYRVHLLPLNAWLATALALSVAGIVWGERTRAVVWGVPILGIAGAGLCVWIARGGRFSPIDGLVKPSLWLAAGVLLALSLRRIVVLLRKRREEPTTPA